MLEGVVCLAKLDPQADGVVGCREVQKIEFSVRCNIEGNILRAGQS